MNQAVWAEGKQGEMNLGFAFCFDVAAKKGAEISVFVSASNAYKMFVFDSLKGYGPARCAHGHARIDRYTLCAAEDVTYLTFEVVSYGVNGSYYIKEPAFFDCEILVDGVPYKTSCDALAYLLSDRVQRVQKYSFERTFAEVYRMDCDRSALYLRKAFPYPRVALSRVCAPIYHERGVRYPTLKKAPAFCEIERGCVTYDPQKPLFRDRTITYINDTDLFGFPYDVLEERISDVVSGFVYTPSVMGEKPYYLYDAGLEYTGLIRLSVHVREKAEIYLLFDEILWDEEENPYRNGERNLSFARLDCCNIVKYTLQKGDYDLETFEPYSLRYLKVVVFGGEAEIREASLRRLENPAEDTFSGEIADDTAQSILDAAFRTYRQNALDVLTDCPSRERAGWINDSFFTSQADLLFTGKAQAERNLLESILLSPQLPQLPEGMLPMCYPCDHLDGNYIPLCPMWSLSEMCRRLARFPDEKMDRMLKEKAEKVLACYARYENEDGLLEDLGGWMFVEWSICSSPEYVAGVNYPANMLYYMLLRHLGEHFKREDYLQKAERVKEAVLLGSYNGSWFEDNRVRDENGVLCLKGHISETCQYHAFFTGIADQESHPALYHTLFDQSREVLLRAYPTLPPSNVIVGLLMRMTILRENGNKQLLLTECKEIFSKMAHRTATLWEHNGISASCNHGITSITANWLLYAYTGYLGVQDGALHFDKDFVGTDCAFSFFYEDAPIHIAVKNGERRVESILPQIVL